MESTIKLSEVTKVVPTNKPYESQYGTLHGYYITFANGDNGKYNSKSEQQDKFMLGEQVNYEISGKEYNGKMFYNIKPSNPDFEGSTTPSESAPASLPATPAAKAFGTKPTTHTAKDELIVRQTALKASAEIGGKDLATILDNAERMVNWVLSKKPETSGATHAEHFSGREKVAVTEKVADDGLPF
tara:strand:+ start:2120 stop:2677 length:558 start_codon:yes stop_codon:yes gene_type:complete